MNLNIFKKLYSKDWFGIVFFCNRSASRLRKAKRKNATRKERHWRKNLQKEYEEENV